MITCPFKSRVCHAFASRAWQKYAYITWYVGQLGDISEIGVILLDGRLGNCSCFVFRTEFGMDSYQQEINEETLMATLNKMHQKMYLNDQSWRNGSSLKYIKWCALALFHKCFINLSLQHLRAETVFLPDNGRAHWRYNVTKHYLRRTK